LVFDEAPRHLLGVAGVDLSASGTRRPEGDAAELQACGRGRSALLDEVERKRLGLLVLRLLQHFEAVDDGAGRTNQVMAYARAQKRCKVERIERDGHGRLRADGR